MPSPVGNTHSEAHSDILGWLFLYAIATPGVRRGDNVTVRLADNSEVQPDALLRIDEQCGGRSRVGQNDFVEGPPELVVEIAASSASYDLDDKLKLYQRAGVREYVVWRVDDHQIDWFVLHGSALCGAEAQCARWLYQHDLSRIASGNGSHAGRRPGNRGR